MPSSDRIELRRIECPHPDIELGVTPSNLNYLVCLPDAGLTAETGLVLFFTDYGMDPCGPYVSRLLPYLANKHDCVAASVDYFGANLWAPNKCNWVPQADFFVNLKKLYGVEVTAPKGFNVRVMAYELAHYLLQKGVTSLNPACHLWGVSTEYHSMGFLPALDGLHVAHRLIGEFPVNKRRLFLLGTSYGGYIVNLMAKFAPRSFRMVIDNSGFASAEDDIWNVYGTSKWHFPGGFSIATQMVSRFSQEPKDAHFFSPSREKIRNLLEPSHVFPGTARLYGYHSVDDSVAPTEHKIQLRDAYAGKTLYELELVNESKLDGRIFKNLSHGMQASMRGLFDLSHGKFLRDGGPLADDTDFDRASRYVFACGDEDYVIGFSRRGGVRAQLGKR
jgi:hypothetical protein